MNYAIDKNAYIQLMYSGYGKPATSVVPSIIGGYEEQEAYTYDVDKAKELMKEDVYKRQAILQTDWEILKAFRLNGKCRRNLLHSLMTVSYTHLDVYKRQEERCCCKAVISEN